MNFNIIEGDYTSLYDKAESFAKLYNDENLLTKDIKKKLDLSNAQYLKLRKYCLKKGLLKIRRVRDNINAKYYYYRNQDGYFHVRKNHKYYACFKTSEKAKKFVEFMKQYNWDKSKVEYVKELMREKKNDG